MTFKSEIMDEAAVMRALKRITFEIEEKNKGFDDVRFIGIERRGVTLASVMADFIRSNSGASVPVGSVNITMYRDDLSPDENNGKLKSADIDFDINGKQAVLVDDVIYTGRTARAAIDALFSAGRPSSIQLAVLIDRGHRELPIRPDYVGKNIPTSSLETVKVSVPQYDGCTKAEIFSKD